MVAEQILTISHVPLQPIISSATPLSYPPRTLYVLDSIYYFPHEMVKGPISTVACLPLQPTSLQQLIYRTLHAYFMS